MATGLPFKRKKAAADSLAAASSSAAALAGDVETIEHAPRGPGKTTAFNKAVAKAAKKAAPKRVKKPPITTVDPKTEIAAVWLPDGLDHFIPVDLLLKYTNFVAEYLKSGDAVAASALAGFVGTSEQSQKGIASRLVCNKTIVQMVADQYKSIIAKTGATVERVWEEISYAAFCDPGKAYNEAGEPLKPGEIPEDVRRAITGYKVVEKTFGEEGSSIEKEVKFSGKDAALDKLIRLHRMVDNDKLVIMNGDEFLAAMEEGRERAAKR